MYLPVNHLTGACLAIYGAICIKLPGQVTGLIMMKSDKDCLYLTVKVK